MYEIVNKFNIKYVLDLHGMKKERKIDVNLGINFGQNIGSDFEAFEKLKMLLVQNGFSISIDQPFKGGVNTVSNFINYALGTWSVQVEVNCNITNNKENFKKFVKLIDTLSNFIFYLEDRVIKK